MSCKVVLEAESESLEGRSTFCRKRQHVQRTLNFVVGGLALWRLLQNQMGVGAPKPKLLTPAKRGCSSGSHGRRSEEMTRGVFSKEMWGFNFSKWGWAGISPCLRQSNTLTRLATPAAASR